MARAWQRLTWVALSTAALCLAPRAAAQVLDAGADPGVPSEASNAAGGEAPPPNPVKARPARTAAKKDPAVAEREIEAGIASLQAGKAGLAVQQLTAALTGGGLRSAQMAKALYHRGVAYRQQRKPAQAIADLTGALWIKNGLGDSDRADALEMRAAAYRDAGLPDQTDPEAKKLAAAKPEDSSKAAAAAPPSEGHTNEAMVASAAPAEASASAGGIGGFFGSLFGGGASGRGVQTGAVPASTPPPTASGWVDFGAWFDGTEVRKGGR
jgi:tetratricopeptide (TPR) repeat protein